MKVALRADGPRRVWHARLAERLATAGHELLPPVGRPAKRRPTTLSMLFAFEKQVYGAASALFEPAEPERVQTNSTAADLSIEVLFDGKAGERALLEALLRGVAPLIVVRGLADGTWRHLAAGLPAIEQPEILARALDQVLLRLVSLIAQAVRHHETGTAPGAVSSAVPASTRPSPFLFLARGLARKLARRFGPARGRPEHWRIATRWLEGDTAPTAMAWPPTGFTALPEDAARFRADPFPFEHDGRRYLFLEDFPYATRKGVIAMAEIDSTGSVSPPRVVLEQPFHLSYPLVFAHEEAIYMLPETSAARRLQLFRADPFPDRWVADRVLVDDVVAADATPVLHEGTYWLFATLSDDGGSSWDQLGLFHAPSPLGPWTAHAANPVLVDAGAARPAGAMWREGGALMRVAQDCRGGYGLGLAICRVDRLDREGYAQTVVRRLGPPDGFGADGVHTLNRVGSLEVIDLRSPWAKG